MKLSLLQRASDFTKMHAVPNKSYLQISVDVTNGRLHMDSLYGVNYQKMYDDKNIIPVAVTDSPMSVQDIQDLADKVVLGHESVMVFYSVFRNLPDSKPLLGLFGLQKNAEMAAERAWKENGLAVIVYENIYVNDELVQKNLISEVPF